MEKYGQPDVLSQTEIAKPTVKDKEVLVEVHAATITPFDWYMLTGTLPLARCSRDCLGPRIRFWALMWQDEWRRIDFPRDEAAAVNYALNPGNICLLF